MRIIKFMMTIIKNINLDLVDQRKYMSGIKQKIIQRIGNDKLAYICWLCGSILWILGFIFPNEHNIDIVASNLSRGIGLVIFNALFLYVPILFNAPVDKNSNNKYMNKKSENYLTLRGFLLAAYSYVFSESHFYLPSPIVYTIFSSGPLFVLTIEYFLYNQKITKQQLKGVIIATIGVFLTANGIIITKFIFQDSSIDSTQFQHYKTTDPYIKSIAAFILICMQLAWSTAVVVVKHIQKITHYQGNFNFGIVIIILVGFVYQFKQKTAFTSENIQLFLQCIIFQGIILAVSQACFMEALLLTEKKGIISMIGFIGVAFSYMLSILRYSQPLNFVCLIGVICVIFGIYLIVMKKKNPQ